MVHVECPQVVAVARRVDPHPRLRRVRPARGPLLRRFVAPARHKRVVRHVRGRDPHNAVEELRVWSEDRAGRPEAALSARGLGRQEQVDVDRGAVERVDDALAGPRPIGPDRAVEGPVESLGDRGGRRGCNQQKSGRRQQRKSNDQLQASSPVPRQWFPADLPIGTFTSGATPYGQPSGRAPVRVQG